MKNKFLFSLTLLFIAVIGGALLFGSCKKYLKPTPISTFDPAFVFGNIDNARAALLGAYNDMEGDNGYGIRLSMYYPYDNDEMLGAQGTGDNDRRDIAHYLLTAGNAQLSVPFNQLYQGIERANNCIYYIPKMALYTNGSDAQKGQLKRMQGEALTLRAQYYQELIRNWGDVPAQFQPAAFTADPYLVKTNRDTIYDHILADLKTAEDLVPWRTELGAIGDVWDQRFTKGAVKALRAKIALARGGYSLRIDTRKMERRSDYLNFYTIARQECAELMARRDQHTLNASFKALWRSVNAHQANDPSGEIMMRVGFTSGTNTDSRFNNYNGTRVNGVTGSTLTVFPMTFYMYDSTDLRRDVSCAPYEIALDTVKRGHNINSIYDAKYRKEWMTSPSYYFSAGVGSTSYTLASNNQTLNFQLDWPLIRFSDVLLMFAEADNEVNGAPGADAIAAVTEVSTRGHGGNAALVPPIPTDHDGFFKFIVKERMLEFLGEGIRKYDLLRWNLLSTAITQVKSNLAAFAATDPAAQVFTPYSYMAPPPSYALTNNLPDSMFFTTVNGGGSALFGPTTDKNDDYKVFVNSYYQPAPTTKPKGTTKVLWMGYSGITTNLTNYFAIGFQEGRNELLPFPQVALDANSNLKQNPGF